MATVITSECINCGACEPECPNTAIYQGGVEWELNGTMHAAIAQDIFYIVPDKCTECVGFFDHEACAAVCPVDCCVPDPNIPETEDVLIARAKALHPDQAFTADFPSRFRKEGAAGAPAETTAAPTIAATAPPAPSPAAATPPPAPPAAPAVAAPAAAPSAAARVEKKLAPPKPAAPTPAREIKPKVFPGELPCSFEEAMARLGTVRPDTPAGVKLFAAAAQPFLGALPHAQKKNLEAAVGDPHYFTTAGATGLNILHNMILYPLIIAAIGALLLDREVFSKQLNGLIILGVGIAALEMVLRLREGVLHALPMDRWVYRGTWYAAPLIPLLSPLTRKLAPTATQGTIPVDGFRGDVFEDKIERERRYGEVYSLKEEGNGFLLRVEFPRRVPQSAMKDELGIPDDMPDYDYDLSFRNGHFVVKGSIVDKNLRKLAAVSPAFPPDFTTNVELPKPVSGFKHRVRDKTLEVVLVRR